MNDWRDLVDDYDVESSDILHRSGSKHYRPSNVVYSAKGPSKKRTPWLIDISYTHNVLADESHAACGRLY